MFTEFFFTLRRRKVPVSLTEWMTLMEALSRGCITSLDDFYYLGRAILVKNEAYFDDYDVAFQEYFHGIEFPMEIPEEVHNWLEGLIQTLARDAAEMDLFSKMGMEELLRELEKRLREQKEQHDGGSYWIGRGGTSPFGHSGSNPRGIRIGGEGGGRHAIKIAGERRFRNYRNDLTLDVRQVKIALRRLRKLKRIGQEDELDLDGTINATAKNYGDLSVIWRKSRKNSVKLLLLMDVGGSMDPYAQLCSQLFSAAHSSTHFKDFQYYFFHNCVYHRLYRDIERREGVSTQYLLNNLESGYQVMIVGDARMGYWELMEPRGSIDYYDSDETPGIVWLKKIAQHFPRCIWLNPEGGGFLEQPTVRTISGLFPMYALTLEGLDAGLQNLIVKK
jgi:uncharacterized protein